MPARRVHVAVGLLLGACIIPDRDIHVDPGLENSSAVRIVQRSPQLPEMDARCNDPDTKRREPEYCPQVLASRPSGLLRPDDGDFCICPAGDRRALPSFDVYAEDDDSDGDAPKDSVFGVALLDADPAAAEPNEAVAYAKHWEPGRAGALVELEDAVAGDATELPNGRAALPVLWRFTLDKGNGDRRIDLCNEAGRPLLAGLHDLRFMVTDRPFFRPQLLDSGGEPAVDANGRPVYGATQFGVPDLAEGATYATIDFVFECRDAADPEAECDCEEVEGG
ncbi:MAG: hypothetical protein IPK74_19285 [Deltaproteobacteria bacterium]|nr:hypothetical protein [Deltaproteobacteria bacterium]